jgi:DNA-binding NtrC family response regulator
VKKEKFAKQINILVIDDEQSQRDILTDILVDTGYAASNAPDGESGLEMAAAGDFQLVLTDFKMPGKDGVEVLKGIQELNPEIQVIIMTAFGTIPGAVNAIKSGAYDYLTKPFKKEELLRVVARAAEKAQLLIENQRLKNEISSRYQYQNLIGGSSAMRTIYQLIERIKDIDATVLISGESGTGKELAAKAIHYSGKRKDCPFVALNCGAIPETLIESELFGHEKGSFTGAIKTYIGKF